MTKPDIKFLIVGCGSIGKRHLSNLKSLSAGELIAYDTSRERREEVGEKYGAEVASSFEEAMGHEPDAVLVCTPSSRHIDYALAAAKQGCHLFIEKPISHNMDGVDELIELASSKKSAILVGCNFRFHPGLALAKKLADQGSIGRLLGARAEFGQYLPDWHPWEDYRKGYSANKVLGGGIILDAVHEIDYVQWIMGAVTSISCFSGKISSLDIDTEDTAEILLRCEGGAIASIHMDYIQRAYSRSCRFFGDEGTIIWDYAGQKTSIFTAKSPHWQETMTKNEPNTMYIEEMKHFIKCIKGEEKPMADGAAVRHVLKIALAAKESSKSGKVINL